MRDPTAISKSDIYLLITHLWFIGSFLNKSLAESILMFGAGTLFGILMILTKYLENRIDRSFRKMERSKRDLNFKVAEIIIGLLGTIAGGKKHGNQKRAKSRSKR